MLANVVIPAVFMVLLWLFEEEPEMLHKILQAVEHPKIRMCLDIGHVHAYSSFGIDQWLELCGPYISHFHIHNNDSTWDTHSNLDEGTIPMEEVLGLIGQFCPDATCTLEVLQGEPAVDWLKKRQMI